MRVPRRPLQAIEGDRGGTAIIVAIVLLMLLGFAALGVDVGYLMVVKNELQNAADASALAGARQMGEIYAGLSLSEQSTYVFSRTEIVSVAQDIGSKNLVTDVGLRNQAGDANLGILDADVKIGLWNWGESKWDHDTLGGSPSEQPDAVRVTARRDESINGPAETLFTRIWDIMNVSVSAVATAALSSLGEVAEGELELPIGISSVWFDRGTFCGEEVTFYPTNDSCAGWTNFSDTKSVNDAVLKKDILPGILDHSYESPPVTVPTTEFYFGGGNLSENTFLALDDLFNDRRTQDGDGNDATWTTLVLVYANEGDTVESCSNPNPSGGPLPIVGFATIVLEEVVDAAGKKLVGTVICDKVSDGRGGGGSYGTVGTIPGLVE